MEIRRQEEGGIRAYWEVISRHWTYVIITFLGVLVSTAVFTFVAEPVYQATAEILIKQRSAPLQALDLPVELAGILGGTGRTVLANQIELIESQQVLRRLQERLLGDAEFMAALNRKKGGFHVALASNGQKIPDSLSIESLRSSINVRRITDTDMLRIEVRRHSPLEAAKIANHLVAAYQEVSQEMAKSSLRGMLEFLDQQIQETRQHLELSEEKLAQFAKQLGLPLVEGNVISSKFSRLAELLAEASVELEDKRDQLAAVDKLLADVKKEILSSLASEEGAAALLELQDKLAVIRQIQREIAQLEEDRIEYLREGDYIRAQELEQKIIDKRRQLEEAASEQFTILEQLPQYEELIRRQLDLSLEITALENRVKILQQRIDQETQTLIDHGLELARLQRELEVTEELYTLLLSEYAKAKMAEAGELGYVEVVDLAEVPEAPIKPNKPLNLLLGFIFGLAGGVGVAFLREALDTRFRSAQEVEETLAVPVLTTIPRIRHPKKRSLFEETKELLLPELGAKGVEFDAFSSLATNLRFLSPDKPLRVLLITSPGPEVGKSMVAANLALISTTEDKPTVLVEVDFRRPSLHKVFGLEEGKGPGLAELVLGEAPLEEVIREIRYEGYPPLHFIPAGKRPPNIPEFLASQKFAELLRELARTYKLVVLDAPPIHVAADAQVLATQVDGVLLVLDAERTTKKETEAAKQALERYQAPLVGAVLNKVARNWGEYRYYYYKYYRKEE